MRLVGALFVAVHGLGHVIWFMATWAQWSLGTLGRAELERHERNFLVRPLSPIGKVVGLLALLSLAGFVAAAWGIWTEAAWWPELVVASAVPSMLALVAMWNPVRTVSVRAFLANVLLGAAMIMPWGERFLGAH